MITKMIGTRNRFWLVLAAVILFAALVGLGSVSSAASANIASANSQVNSQAHGRNNGKFVQHIVRADQAATLQSTEGYDLPPDTPVISLDKAVTGTLDADNTTRLYKFQGKANQLVNIAVVPQKPELYVSMTLLDSDLQSVLAASEGEALVSSSLAAKLPADGEYVISVDFSDLAGATPAPGDFSLTVSEYKPAK